MSGERRNDFDRHKKTDRAEARTERTRSDLHLSVRRVILRWVILRARFCVRTRESLAAIALPRFKPRTHLLWCFRCCRCFYCCCCLRSVYSSGGSGAGRGWRPRRRGTRSIRPPPPCSPASCTPCRPYEFLCRGRSPSTCPPCSSDTASRDVTTHAEKSKGSTRFWWWNRLSLVGRPC